MGGGKQLIGGGIIALALFLFWVFPYAEYAKISSLRSTIADRDAILKQRTEIQAQIKNLTSQYNQQIGAVKVLTAVVPTKKETAEIISALEAIAQQNGIQLAGVNFSSSAGNAEKPYNTLQVSITGNGSYSSIRGMLDSMERNVRLIDVQNIKLSVDQQTSRIDFDIQAFVYFLK